MLTADVLPPRSHRVKRFMLRGVRSLGLGVIIAIVLTIAYGHNFWPTLLYSCLIALGCWFCIDTGRMAVARWVYRNQPEHGAYGQWPGWQWMVLIVPVGTIIGFTAGNSFANLITGLNSPGIVDVSDTRKALGILIFALVPGISATYFFYSRERLAISEAQAQTAQLAKLYAQYRVLAAENRLIQCLNVQLPLAARTDQMAKYRVNPIPPSDLLEDSLPAPAMGPPVPIGGTPAGATPGEMMTNPTTTPSGR